MFKFATGIALYAIHNHFKSLFACLEMRKKCKILFMVSMHFNKYKIISYSIAILGSIAAAIKLNIFTCKLFEHVLYRFKASLSLFKKTEAQRRW